MHFLGSYMETARFYGCIMYLLDWITAPPGLPCQCAGLELLILSSVIKASEWRFGIPLSTVGLHSWTWTANWRFIYFNTLMFGEDGKWKSTYPKTKTNDTNWKYGTKRNHNRRWLNRWLSFLCTLVLGATPEESRCVKCEVADHLRP